MKFASLTAHPRPASNETDPRLARRSVVRLSIFTLLIFANTAPAQVISAPVTLQRSGYVLPPAVAADGQTVAFGSNVFPDGSAILPSTDAFVQVQGIGFPTLRRLTSTTADQSVTAVSLTPDGTQIAYTLYASSSAVEEVHIVNGTTRADTTVAVDKLSCVKPALVCPNCIFACLDAPHITPDATAVLYSAKRSKPFYVAPVNGTVTNLPVFSGSLAPAPVRIISNSGIVVFASSAPNGPTTVASATDVYRMKLDGTGIQAVTHFGSNANIYARNATISADGSWIAFESNWDPVTQSAGSTVRVFAVAPDGTGLRQISDAASDATNPSLTSNGSVIAYLQGSSIQMRRTAGPDTSVKPIEYTGTLVQDPVLSEDGSLMVFTLAAPGGPRTAVIRVATASRGEASVFAPQFLQPGGVVSAAGMGLSPSPGSLISVYGANFTFTSDITTPSGFPLPTRLAGLSILGGGRELPLVAVSRWQINAELPMDVDPSTLDFQLRAVSGPTSNAVTTPLKAVAPSFFVWTAAMPNGQGNYWQAAALHAGTGIPADAAHPATAGEMLEFYGAGFGPTIPVVAGGEASPSNPLATLPKAPEIRICGIPAQVSFAGLAPGMAGVYQLDVALPSGVKAGLCTVEARLGDSVDSLSQIAVR